MLINSNITIGCCFLSISNKNAVYVFSIAPNPVMQYATKRVLIGGREMLPYDDLNKCSILLRNEESVPRGRLSPYLGCSLLPISYARLSNAAREPLYGCCIRQ